MPPGPGITHWAADLAYWNIGTPYPGMKRYAGNFHHAHDLQPGGVYWWWLDTPFNTFTLSSSPNFPGYWPLPATYRTPVRCHFQYRSSSNMSVQINYAHRAAIGQSPYPLSGSATRIGLGTFSLPATGSAWKQMVGEQAELTANKAFYDTGSTSLGYYDWVEMIVSGSPGTLYIYQLAVVEIAGVSAERTLTSGSLKQHTVVFD